jgi:cellulose synthase/poly-beta-1,6-N-acetylglucosamine synthase-like glycosyltransferase
VVDAETWRDPRLSVVIPVRDELPRLPALLTGIESQLWQPHEVVVADGGSTDGTREWLDAAARSRTWLTVVDNPGRTVPAGLNAALASSSGALVARMDAHADYDQDYLLQLVGQLDARPEVVAVGGAMDAVGCGPWGRAIAAILRRPIGMGGAPHRCGGAGGPTNHVFTGCYRRAAIEAVGGYDVRLLANEDFELDVRLREHGGVVWLAPSARCRWYVRESLPALAKQMVRYGYYKGLTLHLHPRSMRRRQSVPPALVLTFGGLLTVDRRWGVAVMAGYLLCSGALGSAAAWSDAADGWRGFAVPAVIHLSWGLGVLVGLVRFLRADRATAQESSAPVAHEFMDG